MGTTFRFVVYAQDDSTVIKAFLSAKKEIDRLNQMMSDYLPESELNLLSLSSGTDTWIKVSDELWEIMALSKKIAKKSKGDFDPTIGPLSRLWRRAIRRQEIPDPAKINEALSQVDYRLIKMNTSQKEILLKEKNMKLDLGELPKGMRWTLYLRFFSILVCKLSLLMERRFAAGRSSQRPERLECGSVRVR
ncbi:MAG: FAD:protein FMN transferase [Bacteroidia bacterium]